MIKEKDEMEYEDAPSGFVTLYNYKEPFMPFSYEGEGYGYEGVLLFDGTSDKIQCHLCGNWYESFSNHLHREHNMQAGDYKDIVGLRQTTALVGEKLRAKMIANGQKRFKNLKPGGKKTQSVKNKISETLKKITREKENEVGTCPFQLIDRLKKKADELGRTPGTREIGFHQTLLNVYGTYEEACRIAGLEVRLPGQVISNSRIITHEQIISFVKDFWIKNNKFPRHKNFKTDRMWEKYKLGKTSINKEVLWGENKFQKTGVRLSYTNEDLLSLLSVFKEKNGRNPSVSDCKRGLLPHASAYYYHFGSLKKALELI